MSDLPFELNSTVKVVVFGAGGQLGLEWMQVLQEKKSQVNGFTSSQADLTKFDQVKQRLDELRPDLIINCAAYTKVDAAENEWAKALSVNGFAVAHLASYCKENNIKLVHFSTDYVFEGTSEDAKRFPNGYTETELTSPQANYAISKLMGEIYLQKINPDYLLIRVAWLCGKYGNNFIKTMLRLAKQRPELNVVADQFGAPSFADHVVENTIALLANKAKGIFHIASEGLTNWHEFAQTAIRLKGYETKVNPISSDQWPSPVKRPSFSKLNTTKISQLNGTRLEHWKEGLERLVRQLPND